MRHQFEDFNKSDKEKIKSIKSSNVDPGLKVLLYDKMFKDACIHLSRIYRIIANRFVETDDDRLEYLTKSYEVSKSSKQFI